MSVSIQPFERYKDTGLPWLPSVPSHWNIKRAKLMLREIEDRSNTGSETLLSVSQYTGVMPRKNREGGDEQDTRSESLVGYKLVCPGDMAVNIMLAWNGSLGVSPYAGVVSPAYCVYRFWPGADPAFYHNLLRTDIYKGRIKVDSRGVVESRLRLYTENLFRLEILEPPLQEQAAIVRFIRHLDQRVNRLIKAKRRLIEALNEQKQAIIHRAVTRGLDPTVPLKPSGIDWLGDIPRHWNLPLLARHVCSIEQGWSPRAAEGDLLDDQWAVVSLSSVKRGRFDNRAVKPIKLDAEVPQQYEIHPGDLLLTRSNTRLLVGDACLVEQARPHTIISDLIYRLKLLPTLEPKFAMYWLLSPSGRYQIERDARGSSGTMPKISQQHIKSWRIPVPTLEEQTKIVAQIDLKTRRISLGISKAEREIELLREYRTRLVSDVVTGQLDVRHLDLPEAGEEEPVIGLADEDTGDDGEGAVGVGEVGDDEGEGEAR